MATETDSVALVTSQNENLLRQDELRQERVESLKERFIVGHFPVFEAFNELGLTGRDIAEISVVTPPP
ncbi:MAG: hypothetical protein JKY92_04475 [Magnetovibrio sp.]|nr:hypothetical protein [Magnetovibrio sp.]